MNDFGFGIPESYSIKLLMCLIDMPFSGIGIPFFAYSQPCINELGLKTFNSDICQQCSAQWTCKRWLQFKQYVRVPT